MKQEDLLNEILRRNDRIEELQKEINVNVLLNRVAVNKDPTFEDDYTESIESYYVNT